VQDQGGDVVGSSSPVGVVNKLGHRSFQIVVAHQDLLDVIALTIPRQSRGDLTCEPLEAA
jgi:hypothetical protein